MRPIREHALLRLRHIALFTAYRTLRSVRRELLPESSNRMLKKALLIHN